MAWVLTVNTPIACSCRPDWNTTQVDLVSLALRHNDRDCARWGALHTVGNKRELIGISPRAEGTSHQCRCWHPSNIGHRTSKQAPGQVGIGLVVGKSSGGARHLPHEEIV